MLPPVSGTFFRERNDGSVDVKFADKRRGLTVVFSVSAEEFASPRTVGESEPYKAYQCIVCRELNKKFRSAAALILDNLRMRLLVGIVPACLAASYAAAFAALLREPVLGKLPEIAVVRAREDELCGDIPLNTLKPCVFGESGFAVGDKVDEFVLGIDAVFSPAPQLLDLGAGRHQSRVNLDEIGAEPLIRKERIEHLSVVFHGGGRQIGHDMESDLYARIAKALVCIDRIGDGVPASVELEDSVVELLNAEFHLGDAEREHSVDMLGQTPVGSGLERDGDAPYACGLVLFAEFLKSKDVAPVLAAVLVHGADALPHEPFLVFGIPCRHGAAHDNEFGFVYVVTQFLELSQSRLHLDVRIVFELSCP